MSTGPTMRLPRVPFVKIRRVVGPHWITGRCGRLRYAVPSYKIKTTVVPCFGGRR